MCYHSNKLNVHYLHYIGSQGLQITSGRGKKETHHHVDHFQATLLRFYHTEESPHTYTSALPGWSVEERQDRGELAHMRRSGKGGGPFQAEMSQYQRRWHFNSSLPAKQTLPRDGKAQDRATAPTASR